MRNSGHVQLPQLTIYCENKFITAVSNDGKKKGNLKKYKRKSRKLTLELGRTKTVTTRISQHERKRVTEE